MSNFVGRPYKENAITRIGKLLRLWLTQEEMNFLDKEAQSLNSSRTQIVRTLIQKCMQENK